MYLYIDVYIYIYIYIYILYIIYTYPSVFENDVLFGFFKNEGYVRVSIFFCSINLYMNYMYDCFVLDSQNPLLMVC